MPTYLPSQPEDEEWDVVIVGTGMGGATLGYRLAQLGRRVLFLEKGMFLFGDADRGSGQLPADADDEPTARLLRGWWPWPIQGKTSFGDVEFFAPLGCGSGGTTGLYAAQLERFHPVDFRPRANFPHVTGTTLPEAWPILYEELESYYQQAESLFRVCGTPDPLYPHADGSLRPPPPLSPRDQDLRDSFIELGLHPYRAHVGYEFVEGCQECGGALCPRECKSDAGRICLLPALHEYGAKILPECDVVRLEADASSVKRVHCQHKGRKLAISARVVALAAGAFMTPVLLLNSESDLWPDGLANRSGLVGRNLMLHSGDFVAVRPRRQLSMIGPKKALALNDFYVAGGTKLGTLQSVGIPVTYGYVLHYLRTLADKDPTWWRRLTRPLLRVAAFVAASHYRNAAVLATIVEDLPYFENRVVADPKSKNGMRFEYRYTDDLMSRNTLLRKQLAEVLGRHHRIAVLTGENNINYGHVCGTCRFGHDPMSSVLDKSNRCHDLPNLYVVDASFFPSSGGTNPSLTIAANALRVAEAIQQQFP